MPITNKQREERIKHLGSSDIPALLGLDPWKNAYDIWLEKTGKLEDFNEESMPMKIGRLFEDGLLAYAQEELGPLRKNVYRSCPGLHIAAHIDGILQGEDLPVEAKMTTGHSKEIWGVGGTDEVPDRVIAQCHAHMICMVKEEPTICYVPHFDPWHGLQMYIVQRSDELIKIISDTALDFWENNVVKDIPTFGQPTLPVALRMKREPGKVKAFNEEEIEFVKEWYRARDTKSAAVKDEETKKAKVLAILEAAEGCEPIEGSEPIPEFGQVTFLQQSCERLDAKKLRGEKPEIFAEFKKTSPFRVLRVKKPTKKEMKEMEAANESAA